MKYKMLTILSVTALSTITFAAEELKVTGMPSISFNSENTFINFNGPTLKLEKGNFSAGFSFMPSLRYNLKPSETSPILGFGLYAGKNKIFLVIPNYYISGAWQSSIGLGYKL